MWVPCSWYLLCVYWVLRVGGGNPDILGTDTTPGVVLVLYLDVLSPWSGLTVINSLIGATFDQSLNLKIIMESGNPVVFFYADPVDSSSALLRMLLFFLRIVFILSIS